MEHEALSIIIIDRGKSSVLKLYIINLDIIIIMSFAANYNQGVVFTISFENSHALCNV